MPTRRPGPRLAGRPHRPFLPRSRDKVANRPEKGRAALLRSLLSPLERRLLAATLVDGRTQAEIAAAERCSQTKVSWRLRQIYVRLATAGITVARRRERLGRTVYMPAEAMDRLTVTGGTARVRRARWRDAKKLERDARQ